MSVRLGAYGGMILLLSGGANGTQLVRRAHDATEVVAPELAGALLAVFAMAAFLASFGGITVIVGALMVERGYRIAGKVAFLLGSGAGLVGFMVQLVALTSTGQNPFIILLGLAVTLQGIGALFAMAAQAIA